MDTRTTVQDYAAPDTSHLANGEFIRVEQKDMTIYYMVVIHLQGIRPENIFITLKRGNLTITYQRQLISGRKNHNGPCFYQWERDIQVPDILDIQHFEKRLESNKIIYLFIKRYSLINSEIYY